MTIHSESGTSKPDATKPSVTTSSAELSKSALIDNRAMIGSDYIFRPWRIVATVLIIFLGVSAWTSWYSTHVSIPRYCDSPANTINTLRKVISERNPAGNDSRRPYLIAAKLLFLVPRQSSETLESYLIRVRGYIEGECE